MKKRKSKGESQTYLNCYRKMYSLATDKRIRGFLLYCGDDTTPSTKRSYSQEDMEELNKLFKELKAYMCQTFIFGLLAADLSDNAKNTLIEIQDKIKEKVNLTDPNLFRHAKIARTRVKTAKIQVESANHFFLKMTNQISNAIIKENGDTCLKYIQKYSDMYCWFLRVFGIIFEQTQYDNDRLEIVWNTLVDLTKQFGLKIDEKEPDWTDFKKVQEEVYKETEKQNI